MDNYRRSSGFLFQRKATVDRLVVIVVNAKTESSDNLDMQESSPGLKDMAYKTATVSMDNYTYETVEMTEELLEGSRQARESTEICRKLLDDNCRAGNKLSPMGHHFEAYVIEINFLDVADKARQEHLLSLPTNFSLDRKDVDDLVKVGGELLCQSEKFQELLVDIGASGCAH